MGRLSSVLLTEVVVFYYKNGIFFKCGEFLLQNWLFFKSGDLLQNWFQQTSQVATFVPEHQTPGQKQNVSHSYGDM